MGASVTSLGRKKNLSSLIYYASSPTEKEKCVAVTGINCHDETEKALIQMNRTRTKMNQSKDRTQAYHVVHSFDKHTSKELTYEEMHTIAVQFAEKSFPKCQVIVASHDDKEHFHSHLVINNIDLETGKRIRIDPKDLERMRNINDETLLENDLKPIDNSYYENLNKRKNVYSNDPSRLRMNQVNHQEVVQEAIEFVLNDSKIHDFESFSDELAKNHHIEVYRYSKNSKKLGYVLYKENANFYDNRKQFILLGENKTTRKEKEKYVERTFSAKKLGTDYSLEKIEEHFRENLNQFHLDNLFHPDTSHAQVVAFGSGINFETGELKLPYVEVDDLASKQFKHSIGDGKTYQYSEFLSIVDEHFSKTIYPEEDNEYEIKLHTHVNPKTLKSEKYQKMVVRKNDKKQLFLPSEGFVQAPHTPSASALHYQICRLMNDDVKMHRAKRDYEFTQRIIDNQQQRQQSFEMDY
ncbi:relaxase/mobilization nuclease domain-containing protein [Enterococcus sp. LJL98]